MSLFKSNVIIVFAFQYVNRTCDTSMDLALEPNDSHFILDVYVEFLAAILKGYVRIQMSYMISTVTEEGTLL